MDTMYLMHEQDEIILSNLLCGGPEHIQYAEDAKMFSALGQAGGSSYNESVNAQTLVGTKATYNCSGDFFGFPKRIILRSVTACIEICPWQGS